jgi:hypothetical protein
VSTPVEIELKPTLSPTALGNYELCGRRGQYYHEKIVPTVTTVGLALGGSWHVAMETYHNARIYYGDSLITLMPGPLLLDNLYQIAVGYFTEQAGRDNFVWQEGESVGETHERLYKMLTTWASDPVARWFADGYVPRATEEEVVVELGSAHHVFRGFIDLVVDTPYGVTLVDHKSAGRAWGGAKAKGDPRKLIQAPLYAEGWERLTGEKVTHVAFDVMTYAGKFQRVWVNVSPKVREPFIDRWGDVSNMIALYKTAGMDLPTNPSNNLCSEKWCSFWEICPMGAALDKEKEDD